MTIDPFRPIVPDLLAEIGQGRILSRPMNLGEPALCHLSQSAKHLLCARWCACPCRLVRSVGSRQFHIISDGRTG